jgi:hypothetical protein
MRNQNPRRGCTRRGPRMRRVDVVRLVPRGRSRCHSKDPHRNRNAVFRFRQVQMMCSCMLKFSPTPAPFGLGAANDGARVGHAGVSDAADVPGIFGVPRAGSCCALGQLGKVRVAYGIANLGFLGYRIESFGVPSQAWRGSDEAMTFLTPLAGVESIGSDGVFPYSIETD